jgi:hypothetical protein
MTKEHLGIKYKEWKDLFRYIDRKCNFHEKKKGDPKSMTWTCFGDLRFAESFCKRHKLDSERVKHILQFFGGFCDCEILFNVNTERYDNIWKDNLMITEKLK